MSTHCSNYPVCGCPEKIGVHCYDAHGRPQSAEVAKALNDKGVIVVGAGSISKAEMVASWIEKLDTLEYHQNEPVELKITAPPVLDNVYMIKDGKQKRRERRAKERRMK